jgi:hypothetical protein
MADPAGPPPVTSALSVQPSAITSGLGPGSAPASLTVSVAPVLAAAVPVGHVYESATSHGLPTAKAPAGGSSSPPHPIQSRVVTAV